MSTQYIVLVQIENEEWRYFGRYVNFTKSQVRSLLNTLPAAWNFEINPI